MGLSANKLAGESFIKDAQLSGIGEKLCEAAKMWLL